MLRRAQELFSNTNTLKQSNDPNVHKDLSSKFNMLKSLNYE